MHPEPPRVLVVDDDVTIRQLVVINLELEGFEVYEAVDGKDCLDRVAECVPDIMILDIMMPGIDGWEVASRLRADPETAHIKVIVITAMGESERRYATRAGVDYFLSKPFDPDDLMGVVQRLAAGQRV